jgi:hypothetical protein
MAQSKNDQVPAQGFGPVSVAGGETLSVCVGNMGEANSRSTVQIFSVSDAGVKFIAKHDPNLASGKGACYTYAPKAATQLFVVLAGDPNAGWDISDRSLMATAQVLDTSGKSRVVLTALPKVVTTKLLQK